MTRVLVVEDDRQPVRALIVDGRPTVPGPAEIPEPVLDRMSTPSVAIRPDTGP